MQNDRIKILYIDDDEGNLTSFQANFRRDYDIHTVTTPQQALEFLEDDWVHIVLSDQRMPNISGVEFFELLLIKHPDPVRILVTGFSDVDAIIAAINDGHVFKYIRKPWKREEVIVEMKSAFEFYKAKQDAILTNRALRSKTQELEKFIYSASHDLRAPLSSVLGLLQITKAEENELKKEEYFKLIEESIKDMDFYIQNMINFYQNQTAEVTRDNIDFDFVSKSMTTNLQQINAQKQVDIQIEIQQDIPFHSDEKRILSALSNLISNGIMYSDDKKERKTIRLNIKVTEEEAIISIVDNGIGMQNTKKLFDLFIKDSKKRGFGSGLGLYVTKEAIVKIDGTIKIDSVLGEGTTVKIKIPNIEE